MLRPDSPTRRDRRAGLLSTALVPAVLLLAPASGWPQAEGPPDAATAPPRAAELREALRQRLRGTIERQRAATARLEAAFKAQRVAFVQDFADPTERQLAVKQAAASAENASLTRDLAELALKEFEKGEVVSAEETANADLALARSNLERANDQREWSEGMVKDGFLPQYQLDADRLAVREAEVAFDKAQLARRRFQDYTKGQRLKRLRSDIAQARAEHLGKQLALEIVQSQAPKDEGRPPNDTTVTTGDWKFDLLFQAIRLEGGVLGLVADPAPQAESIRAKLEQAKQLEGRIRAAREEFPDQLKAAQGWQARWVEQAQLRLEGATLRSEAAALALKEFQDLGGKDEELELARAEARRSVERLELERAERLQKRGLISDLQLETARAKFQGAEIGVDRTRTALRVLRNYTREKETRDRQSAIELARAEKLGAESLLEAEKSKEAKLKRILERGEADSKESQLLAALSEAARLQRLALERLGQDPTPADHGLTRPPAAEWLADQAMATLARALEVATQLGSDPVRDLASGPHPDQLPGRPSETRGAEQARLLEVEFRLLESYAHLWQLQKLARIQQALDERSDDRPAGADEAPEPEERP